MLLKASIASSPLCSRRENLSTLFSSISSSSSSISYSFFPVNSSVSISSILRYSQARNGSGFMVSAASDENNRSLTGVVFEPFEEVRRELNLLPTVPHVSLARQMYSEECVAAVNEQIHVEYNVSYIYHAMFAYFDRDNVALKGLAKFFRESSDEERSHAEKLIEYQNTRGGQVKLHRIPPPLVEYGHEQKGDALYAIELALSLERMVNDKLLLLHRVAERNGDVQLSDYIESEFLSKQVDAIKKISEYVAQLRRVGKGYGVWHFDQMLLHQVKVAA